MSFALYLFGILVALSGVIYGAILLHVSQQWIVVVSTRLGVLSAVANTRSRDKPQ